MNINYLPYEMVNVEYLRSPDIFIHILKIPEYCKVVEESEIIEQAFQLIFAFDEIVALGYRENVNLAQIKTFTEMDSHDERVFEAVRKVSLPKGFCQCSFVIQNVV